MENVTHVAFFFRFYLFILSYQIPRHRGNAAIEHGLWQPPFLPLKEFGNFTFAASRYKGTSMQCMDMYSTCSLTDQTSYLLPPASGQEQSPERRGSSSWTWEPQTSDHTPIRDVPGRTTAFWLPQEAQGRTARSRAQTMGRHPAAQNSPAATSTQEHLLGSVFGFGHCLFKVLQLEAKEEARTKYQLWKEIRRAHMTAARSPTPTGQRVLPRAVSSAILGCWQPPHR